MVLTGAETGERAGVQGVWVPPAQFHLTACILYKPFLSFARPKLYHNHSMP